MSIERERALERIRRNIETHGFHIYVVAGNGPDPRFVYTIGLRESLGAEMVFAGGLYYEKKSDVLAIVNSLREQLGSGAGGAPTEAWRWTLRVDQLGSFSFRKAHSSWTRSLLLGALDYYGIDDVDAYQIVPDDQHMTIDVPSMDKDWNAAAEPIWQWLHEPWRYPVSAASTVMTDLDALHGEPITEACRWEEDYWEMFAGAGPDVSDEMARLVPLGCLLAVDPSLVAVVRLKIGEGLWRDGDGGDWNAWIPRNR
jgi:hypothetical protein